MTKLQGGLKTLELAPCGYAERPRLHAELQKKGTISVKEERNVTAPLSPWRLKNPREPEVQVGVGINQTTI